MLYTNLTDVDFDRYNRLFVFGCSFTGYRWPTWADILSWKMSDAEYHNFARSGAGQLFIVSQLSQAINHHQIGPDDLVAVMWSTFYREDRYLYQRRHQNWSTPGNIYTAQHEVPQDFIDNYVCERGMFVRDLALIDTTMRMLATSNFDSFAALSVPLHQQNYVAGLADNLVDVLQDVIELYQPLEQYLAPCLMETICDQQLGWKIHYKYWDNDMNSEYADYHPSVRCYLKYLSELGVDITDTMEAQAESQHQQMLSITNRNQLVQHEPCLIL